MDYWDATSFDADLYAQMRTPAEVFPTDLKDVVATQADGDLTAAAAQLQSAFATADAAAAASLLHPDVVLEDMTLRTRIVGRIETTAYLARVLDHVPYGSGSTLRHVVGGNGGGGFEWTGADGLVGITAIELDDDNLVTRITSVYDGRQLDADRRTALLNATFA